MNKKLKNDGITLISLVITIIIMLILVGVSITLAVNGGLFEYAGNAVGDTKNAMKNEQSLIDDIIENYIKPNVPEIPEGLKVGDYVNYTPTKGTYRVANGENGTGCDIEEKGEYQEFTTEPEENRLKWRVWSIDERTGKIELISETVAQAENPLYLYGADGYNHAVDILNDLCKTLYSNENGATARSINVEDINAKTTYTVEQDDNYKDSYNQTYSLVEKKYPKLYATELGSTVKGLKETENLLKASIGVRKNDGTADYEKYTGMSTISTFYATYTYYEYKVEDFLNDELGVNTAPKGLININQAFWVASRCCNGFSAKFYFLLRWLSPGGNLTSHGLCSSAIDEEYFEKYYTMRPIVSLGKNTTLIKSETQPSKEFTYWDIEF